MGVERAQCDRLGRSTSNSPACWMHERIALGYKRGLELRVHSGCR